MGRVRLFDEPLILFGDSIQVIPPHQLHRDRTARASEHFLNCFDASGVAASASTALIHISSPSAMGIFFLATGIH
jgi:hypothetical protein